MGVQCLIFLRTWNNTQIFIFCIQLPYVIFHLSMECMYELHTMDMERVVYNAVNAVIGYQIPSLCLRVNAYCIAGRWRRRSMASQRLEMGRKIGKKIPIPPSSYSYSCAHIYALNTKNIADQETLQSDQKNQIHIYIRCLRPMLILWRGKSGKRR